MTVFVCVDERGGMLFGTRRQSYDSAVIADITRTVGEGVLYVTDMSQQLFLDADVSVICVSEPFSSACDEDFIFVEDIPLKRHAPDIDRFIIYNWNRHYPSTVRLDILPCEVGLKLKTAYELVGTSHKKITVEVYER